MDDPGSTIDLLRDPRVKDCFLKLLESSDPGEVKYQKFVEFCAQLGVPRARAAAFLGQAFSGAGDETGIHLEDLLSRIGESIRRAARQMQRSQHQDGGWGLPMMQSGFWHTAYALMFLKSAGEILESEMAGDIYEMLRRGAEWLELHPEGWSPDMVSGTGAISVYDTGLMVLYFYRVGRPFFRREPALRVYRGLDRLYHAQNEDGGWDASIWGYEAGSPVRIWSEVGATSLAMRAMAETHDERFQAAVERGIAWLAGTQNPDGSWNDGACHPALPDFQLGGTPSIPKTCAALQGILAGEALDLPLQPYQDCIEYGLSWLQRLSRPVLDRRRRISRWGWGYASADYERITAILELLLSLPGAASVDMATYVAWLIETQRRQPDDAEDGSWVLGHTARIGLALAGFYHRGKEESVETRIPWIP